MINNLFFGSICLILGITSGSFINAFVWRLKINAGVEPSERDKDLSILTGRSMCPNCRHRLGVFDLIPIVSWIFLRGKCRYCHQKISIQYPVVEISTGLLSLAYLFFWPYRLLQMNNIISFFLALVILYGLVALALYDIKWYVLPTKIIYWLFFIGIIFQLLILHGNYDRAILLNIILGTIIGGGLFYLLYIISSGKWIGGGDIRLGFLLGFLLGSLTNSILLIFFASVFGTILSFLLILFKKSTIKSLVPFGPFLIISYIVIQLFGISIIAWAKTHYLIV